MPEFSLITLQALVLTAMIVGLLGLLTTVIPGLAIIWLAALLYGLITGFSTGSIILFAIITVLWLAGSVVDNVLMGASARQTGASWLAIGVAFVFGLIGTFVFPPFGGIIGALIGIFAVELIRLRDWRQALGSTRSLAVGCGWAVVVRFLIGGLMIGLWLIWAL